MKYFYPFLLSLLLFTATGQILSAQNNPSVSISPGIVDAWLNLCNDSVTVPVQVNNNGTGTLFFNLLHNNGFTDDFEHGLGKWQWTGYWGLDPYAFEGHWSLSESPSSFYGNNWDNYIELKDSLIVTNSDSVNISFFIRYALDCGGDGLDLEYSVNGDTWNYLDSYYCDNGGWESYQYDMSSLVSNGDYIKIRFHFYSDPVNIDNGVNIDNILITGVSAVTSWLSAPITSGVVVPGDNSTFNMTFRSEGLTSGVYSDLFQIQTNDPDHPLIPLLCRFHFHGYPILSFTDVNHSFGDVVATGYKTDSLVVGNTGCDTLYVNDVSTSNTVYFNPVLTTFSVPPGGTFNLPVTFMPDVVDYFEEELYLSTNDTTIDPAQSVSVLSGNGIDPPVLGLNPDTLQIMISCGDFTDYYFDFINSGAGPMDYTLQVQDFTSGLELYYPFDGDATDQSGNSLDGINNGGSGVPDRFNNADQALYFDGSSAVTAPPNHVYFKGDFTVSSWVSVEAVTNWARLFDFGNGPSSDNVLGILSNGDNGYFTGEVYNQNNSGGQIYSPDPIPLNQWIFLTEVLQGDQLSLYKNGILWGSGTTYETPANILRNLDYIGKSNWEYDQNFQGTLDEFRIYNRALTPIEIQNLYNDIQTSWLWIPIPSGTLDAYSGMGMPVTIDATQLTAGTYRSVITITTNDPTAPVVQYPVVLTVVGYPQIMADTALDFGSVPQGSTASGIVNVTNQGCDTLFITGSSSSSPQFGLASGMIPDTLLPGISKTMKINFSAADTGIYSGYITLINNNVDTVIHVTGHTYPAPIIAINPDSITVVVPTCDSSGTAIVNLHNLGYENLIWMADTITGAGKAISFTNVNQVVDIGDMGVMPPQGTIELWQWSNIYYGYNNSFCTNGYDNYQYQNDVGIRFENANGNYYAVVGDDSQNTTMIPIVYPMPVVSWHHVAISWDKNTNQVWTYFDGVKVADGITCTTWATHWVHTIIGAGYGYYRWWNGRLDEVRMWNVIRTQSQIQTYMHQKLAGNEPGLLAYWNFDEPGGNTVTDRSGHGHTGTFDGATRVQSTIQINQYASASPSSGTILPGDSAAITVGLNGLGLQSGNYPGNLLFLSNDSVHPASPLQYIMKIQGLPVMHLNPDTLYMGSVMANATLLDSVEVSNSGCDTLHISGYDTSMVQFHLSPIPLNIAPGHSGTLVVHFTPTDTVTFSGGISLYSNALPASIYVSGQGTPAPLISVTPMAIDTTLACNDSIMIPLEITNNGQFNLNVALSETTEGDILPALCMPATIYNCCGMGIYHVGLAQIDNTTLPSDGYQDYSATQRATLVAGQAYSISVQTGTSYYEYAVAWIDFNDDGIFSSDEVVLQTAPLYIQHTGQFTVLLNAVRSRPLRMRVATDYSGQPMPTPCHTVYYGQVEDYSVVISSSPILPVTGVTIGPGQTNNIDLTFSSVDLTKNTYNYSISLQTNDPLHPSFQIPCSLHITGSANLSLASDTINFGDVMQYSTRTRQISVSNNGCDTLKITSLYSDDTLFNLNSSPFDVEPGGVRQIDLIYAPIQVGQDSGVIHFISNVGNYSITVTGNSTGAPYFGIDSMQIRVSIPCGDSVYVPVNISNTGLVGMNYTINSLSSMDNGLMVYYPFNENLKDYSGHHRDLTNYNASPAYDSIGNQGFAYHFQGNAYMDYENPTDIASNLFNNFASVSVWVKVPAFSTWANSSPVFFNVSGDYNYGEGIWIGAISTTFMCTINVNTVAVSLSSPLVTGQWVNLVYTYDGTYFRAYVNGNKVGEKNVPGHITYSSNYRTLGIGNLIALPNPNRWYTGDMDEVRLYNRALSSQEVNMLYNFGTLSKGISANPSGGSIPTGSGQQVMVKINASGMNSGHYPGSMDIQTNDPQHAEIHLPVIFNITGTPQPVVSPVCLHYDSTMQFTASTDSILITNQGCADMVITNIYSPGNSFIALQTQFVVEPSSSHWFKIRFSPQAEGLILDTLHIVSNTIEQTVCLSGFCTAIPIEELSPATINKILSCSQTGSSTLMVRNHGLAGLNFNIQPAAGTVWMNLTVLTGTVGPLDSVPVIIQFDRSGQGTGLLTSHITVTSNDPVHSSVVVPIYLLLPNPLVPVNLGNDTGFCLGGSMYLHAGSYTSYLWNDGSTNQNLFVDSAGDYSVTVVDVYGCATSDTVHVSEFGYPVAMAGSDTSLCAFGTVVLNGNASNTLPSYPSVGKVGNGTSFSGDNGPDPFATYYLEHRVQFLYLKSELLAAGLGAGNLTSLGIVAGSIGYPALSNFNIRLKHTNQSVLNGFTSGLTNVFSSSSYLPVAGDNLFVLQNPFYWDGNSNLVVEFCYTNTYWGNNSTYEYTSVPGKTWGAYCDNCSSGCSLSGGASYSSRANLILHGNGSLTKYTWTGPGNFTENFQSYSIANIQMQQQGWYHLQVDNGYGCTDHDSLYVTVYPSPTVNAGPELQILQADSILIAATADGGVLPYTISWTPPAGLNDNLTLQPKASPSATTTYTLTVGGNNGCNSTDQVTVNVTPRFPVSGQVTYSNAYYSSLSNVKVILKDGQANVLDSTITDQAGNYIFPLEQSGAYAVTAKSSQPSGGYNATDALLIARYIVFLQTLTGVRLQAADVNASHTVSSADALLVLRRTVGYINSFPAGDWAFENKSFNVSNAPAYVNFFGSSMGDVNGSFIPAAKLNPTLGLEETGVMTVEPGEEIRIPVSLSTDMNLGAITLVLKYPADLIEIYSLQSPLKDLLYTIQDGNIRVAWSKTEGYMYQTGAPLFTLTGRRTSTGSGTEGIRFLPGGESELADSSSQVIYGASVVVPRIMEKTLMHGGCYLGQNRPNPAMESTEIPFFIPGRGKVLLVLENLVGERLQTLVDAELDGGSQSVTLDCSKLPAGLYIYKLAYSGSQGNSFQSRKMVINR